MISPKADERLAVYFGDAGRRRLRGTQGCPRGARESSDRTKTGSGRAKAADDERAEMLIREQAARADS